MTSAIWIMTSYKKSLIHLAIHSTNMNLYLFF